MRATIIVMGILCSCSSTFAAATECTQASRSDNIVLMRCSADATSETWVEAAKKACGNDKSCNVWFWPKDVELPETAPLTDTELPKSLTAQALAVWANDSSSLLTLKKSLPN